MAPPFPVAPSYSSPPTVSRANHAKASRRKAPPPGPMAGTPQPVNHPPRSPPLPVHHATMNPSLPPLTQGLAVAPPILEPPQLTPKRKAVVSPASPRPNTKRPASSLNINPFSLRRNDCLGTLVNQLARDYVASESWEYFVQEFRGRSYLSPMLEHIDHPAAALLQSWRDHGVPALTSSPPWSTETK